MSSDRFEEQFLRSTSCLISFILFFKMIELFALRSNLLRDCRRIIERFRLLLLLSSTKETYRTSNRLLGRSAKRRNVEGVLLLLVTGRLVEHAYLLLFRFLLTE